VGAPLEKTSVPGVYRRGGRYAVMYRDPTGKQRSRAAASMAEARSLKSELSADLRRGEYRETSRLTFAEYATDWMRTYSGRTSRGLKATTLADYVSLLEHHVLPVLGHRRLSQVEPRHIKMLASDLAGGGRSASTVRNIIAPVRALFATAVEEGVIRANPCAGLRLSGGARPEHHARALTEDELARLVTEVPERSRLLVVHCPWPPMLKRPQRNAKATARPVKKSVVVMRSVPCRLNAALSRSKPVTQGNSQFRPVPSVRRGGGGLWWLSARRPLVRCRPSDCAS
jgi:Phage integrase, N-terminal SAM-like domain